MAATSVLIASGLSSAAHAATYYLSPTGSDSNSGTSAALPWKTFAFAIPKLQPGDTLTLLNGTYNVSNSGFPSIDCTRGASNGTASQPITVQALNERQAFLQSNGTVTAFTIANCAYWNIVGLRIEAADNASGAGEPMDVLSSDHVTLKRLLLARNNRYSNVHLLSILNSTNILVEESELYYFHRHAILNWYTDHSIYRRIYCHSRGYQDIPGGASSHTPDRGDGCVAIYPGNHNILENVISERNYELTEINGSDTNVGNRVLGSISLDDYVGAIPNARGFTLQYMPRDVTFKDFVAIRPLWYGLKSEAGKNIQCNGCTVLNSGIDGFNVTDAGGYGDGSQSFFATNTLVANSSSLGFYISNQADWQLDHPNPFGNGTNYFPAPPNSHIVSPLTTNPQLGACLVYIPSSSPMNGAGTNGADIGANVLYRYQNGTLTTTPLWNTTTGAFPCGAKVSGLNDSTGNSCFDVHSRLNVNTSSCPFPSGYGGQPSSPPTPPTNLRVVQQ